MKIINCSGAIFIDGSGKILLEDRRKISKNGEEWGFFGGHAEDGETEEETLQREIMEELNYKLIDYSFFKKYHVNNDYENALHIMYLARMPDLKDITPHKDSDAKIFTINQALNLKMMDVDKEILRDLQKYILINNNLNI